MVLARWCVGVKQNIRLPIVGRSQEVHRDRLKMLTMTVERSGAPQSTN